jgi:vacuolar-type H+-ATPase subunit I/STV1
MIIVFVVSLVITHLAKYGVAFFRRTQEGLDNTEVPSSTAHEEKMKEQQTEIASLTEQLKEAELTNLQEIARLKKLLEETKKLQATTTQ